MQNPLPARLGRPPFFKGGRPKRGSMTAAFAAFRPLGRALKARPRQARMRACQTPPPLRRSCPFSGLN